MIVLPSADWDWVWDWDWVTQASPKGHPSVTQGSPRGHPSVDWRKCFVCNKLGKMPGGGRKKLPKSPGLPKFGDWDPKPGVSSQRTQRPQRNSGNVPGRENRTFASQLIFY